MVLFWTGRGIVILVIFMVMAVAAVIFTAIDLSRPLGLSADRATNLTIAIAAALTALATWPIGRWIMKQPRKRVIVDRATGRADAVETWDTLLGIGVRYWTYVLAIVAVVMFAVTLLF